MFIDKVAIKDLAWTALLCFSIFFMMPFKARYLPSLALVETNLEFCAVTDRARYFLRVLEAINLVPQRVDQKQFCNHFSLLFAVKSSCVDDSYLDFAR